MKNENKGPLVSVILVNYKSEKVTGECADSVLKTDYPRYEIIIVDNASTPASRRYFQNKYGKNRKVRLFSAQENLNYTGGNSLGAKHARGAKLVFLNNDTVVEPGWLSELVKLQIKQPRSIVQPKIMDFYRPDYLDNAGNNYAFPGIGVGLGHGKKDHGQYDREEKIDYCAGTCYLVDNHLFKRLGGFDDWFQIQYEDVDLQLRAKKHGAESWYCPKSVIYHRGAYTLKTRKLTDFNLYHLRKNRLMTVYKNYDGFERVLRLKAFLAVDIFLVVRGWLGSQNKGGITLKAYRAFIIRIKSGFKTLKTV